MARKQAKKVDPAAIAAKVAAELAPQVAAEVKKARKSAGPAKLPGKPRFKQAAKDVTKTVAFKAALAAAVAEAMKNIQIKDPAAQKLAQPPTPAEAAAIAREVAERTGVRAPTQTARKLNPKPGVSLAPRTGWIVCRPLTDPETGQLILDKRGNPIGGLMRVRENQKREPIRVNKHLYEFAENEFGDWVIQVLHKDDYPAILGISAAYQPYEPPDYDPNEELEEEREPARTTRHTPARKPIVGQRQRAQTEQQRGTRVTRTPKADFDPALDA